VSRRVLLLLAAIAACVPGLGASGADFVATSASGATTFATAADFNTTAVSLGSVGSPLHGAVPLTATASSERGIAEVRFQSAPAGTTTWTDACVDATAPYACTWDTIGVPNGSTDVRAVVTDNAGYSRTVAVTSRTLDNLGPTVALADPGPWLKGTPTISATAADASGVTALSIEYRRAGTTPWLPLCTGAGTSRSCALVAGLPDGDLELRADATDAAGNTRATPTLTRRVDNTAPTVAVTDPVVMRGVVTLAATAADGAGTGVASVKVEYRVSGAATWTTACTDTTAPYTCSFDTAGANGLYDLRATATDVTGQSTVSAVLTRRADNTAPSSATLVNPGTTLQGAVAVSGTAADAGSGVASWTLQFRTAGTGAWTDGCADTTSPYGCTWATTAVADGLYDLRALATDGGGLTIASTVLTNRRVDNLGPTVALADPGGPLRGAVTLTATATDPAGMTSVTFERKPAAGSTWTTICNDTTSPWSCSWTTTGLADGIYDLRARATDALGHVTTSIVTGKQVDNTAPIPTDVQAGNGGAVAGQPEAGDWLRFTWSEALRPASVRTGWTGTALAVVVTITDAGTRDTLTIAPASGGGTVNLLGAALRLNADVAGSATVVFDATMTQSATAITVTLGAKRSGTVKTGGARAMSWTASASATDAAGNPSTTTVVTESGASDADF
jgi:hypothetical protein